MAIIRLRKVNERVVQCEDCPALIKWAVTDKNIKDIPLEADAAITGVGDALEVDNRFVHFANCKKPKAGKARKRAKAEVKQLEANQLAELAQLRKEVAELRAYANSCVQPELANQLRDERREAVEVATELRELLVDTVRRLDTQTKEQVADWLEATVQRVAAPAADSTAAAAPIALPHPDNVYPPSKPGRPRYHGD